MPDKPLRLHGGKLPDERKYGEIAGTGRRPTKKIIFFQSPGKGLQECLKGQLPMPVPLRLIVAFRIFISIEMVLEFPIIPGQP